MTKFLLLIPVFLLASFFQQFTVPFVRENSGTLTLNPGWQWGADNSTGSYAPSECSATGSSCTLPNLGGGYPIQPPSGAVTVIWVDTGNSSTNYISSISGTTGGSWVSDCTNCQNSYGGNNFAFAYNLGATSIPEGSVVHLNAASSGFFYVGIAYFVPPSGYTASFDGANFVNTASCTTCSGASPTITATDAVLHLFNASGTAPAWNGCSGPYILDVSSTACEGTNVTSSNSLTVSFPSSQTDFQDVAIAFKSSAGTFSTPSPVFSISSLTWTPDSNTTCSPTCSITLPSSASGNLVMVVGAAANGNYISSASYGGDSLTVPSGSNTCRIANTNTSAPELTCAYLLNAPAETSSAVSITLNSTGNFGYEIYVVSRTSGSFALDTQASNTQAGSLSSYSTPSVTLSGSNDIEFTFQSIEGGITETSYFPGPAGPTSFGWYYADDASGQFLLNTTNAGDNPLANNTTSAMAAATVVFK
jgi:hypothetical protein